MDYDQCYSNFLSLMSEIETYTKLSEADTRSKIIDKILFECLNWHESNITREDHVRLGFTDYQLKINSITQIVIEAKKEGISFEIPISKTSRRYKLDKSFLTDDNITEAIKQVRNYCLEIGAKYAIATNGYQFVIFAAFTSGKSWQETYCIVFKNFDDIKDNFKNFWNLLSYDAVLNGSLVEYLEKNKRSLKFEKIYSMIHNRDQLWSRNKLYTHIQPLADFIFSELLDEAKTRVLKECYVYDRSNESLGQGLNDYFVDKMPHFAADYNVQQIVERASKAGSFEKEVAKLTYKDQSSSLIVLIGGIGSGKSTFLHRFFKIVNEGKDSLLWFYIDFKVSHFESSTIDSYVYSDIYNQFQKHYYAKFSSTLKDVGFNESETDKKIYMQKLFALLKKIGFAITIIIDNVDQHDYDFQEKLFIYSNHICKELKVLTLLALREETFFLSTRTGVFDAYHIPKFHISSPNFLNMIKRRIEFTLDILKQSDSLFNYTSDISKDLIHFFEILNRSFNKENKQSVQIIKFFDNISVGNMREALRMFNNFLISGNTNINEMFQKENEDDTFQIAFHQLFKSIILGEHRFYCSERSHIANLFDFDPSLTDSHFHQIRLLKYLELKNNSKSDIGRGYININDLLNTVEEIAITRKVLYDALNRLAIFMLISYDNQSPTDIENASYVKITPAGQLYLNDLIYQFPYLDAIMVDTPISDRDKYHEIKQLLNDQKLAARLKKTKIFLTYLRESEKNEFGENPHYLQSEFSNHFFVDDVIRHFNKHVEYLKNKQVIDNQDDYLFEV